jgi:ribosomal protein S18 acetylase RimI-like enzyme
MAAWSVLNCRRQSTPNKVEEHLLDRPIWHALTSLQSDFAVGTDQARRYAIDIGPLAGSPDESDESLQALADLLKLDGTLVLFAQPGDPLPPGAVIERQGEGLQMVATRPFDGTAPNGLLKLSDADAPEMLALATLTEPGPFRTRTHALGQFWGLRDEGMLVAMAGERMKLPGYGEVSAVCTHPEHRGRGHAASLLQFVAAQIEARGDKPMLHSYAGNAAAIRVYESLGFVVRRECLFRFLRSA